MQLKNKKYIYLLLALLVFQQLAFAQTPTYHPDDKEGLRAFLRQPSAVTVCYM